MLAAQSPDRKFDRKLARQIIQAARAYPTVGERLKAITANFVGVPYVVAPLVGSAGTREVLVATLSGFDCVTLMETALALAWAETADEVLALLRQIRYKDGEVAWSQRLHYTTDWAKYHVRRGWLEDLTHGPAAAKREKVLSLVPGLASRRTSFSYFPTRKLGAVSRELRDGDLVFFVSTRPGLDVFHVGLVFRVGERLVLRHASRSRGGVVEQELSEFVKANRMSGLIVVRPKESVSAGEVKLI